jgi:hypothetical protein
VIGYFCVSAAIPIPLLVFGALEGNAFWVALGGVGALYLAVEAAVYVPRARKAMAQVGDPS